MIYALWICLAVRSFRQWKRIGDVEKEVRSFSESMAESQVIDGVQYFKIFDDKRLEYILLIQGQNENDYTIGKLAVFQIENLLVAYKERFDKENFVKNLLLDNLLLVDIYNRAKKLYIDRREKTDCISDPDFLWQRS